MKILLLDIETSPMSGYFWALFKQNININQIVDTSRVLCVAYKWLGEKKTHFVSEWQDGHEEMLQTIYDVLSEADVVITYNGDRFDIPVLNKEFLLKGWTPPAPFKSLDLILTMKSKFRFASNKLDHITRALGLEGKVAHSGFQLWLDVMEGEPKACKVMEKYNRKDVTLLEDLYLIARPWVKMHPNQSHFHGDKVCPKCGSHDISPRGFFPSAVGPKQRYRCNPCGAWSHDTKVTEKNDINKRMVSE